VLPARLLVGMLPRPCRILAWRKALKQFLIQKAKILLKAEGQSSWQGGAYDSSKASLAVDDALGAGDEWKC